MFNAPPWISVYFGSFSPLSGTRKSMISVG
jgi:hypothetical protein